jgi:hypothetical protein
MGISPTFPIVEQTRDLSVPSTFRRATRPVVRGAARFVETHSRPRRSERIGRPRWLVLAAQRAFANRFETFTMKNYRRSRITVRWGAMRIPASSFLAAVALGSVLLMTSAVEVRAAESADAAKIRELQKQEDALTKELAKVNSGTDLRARQKAMQRHWTMMQNYMQSIRQTRAVAANGCNDWMMVGPGLRGSGTAASGTACPWGHGTGTMGQEMMNWALPNETPEQYQQRMQVLQLEMRKQLAAIVGQTDPAKRDALLRQHYDAVYRNMQTMRGMGWMWDLSAASAFPDASSPGGQLEGKYCSQCHAAPPPSLHSAKEWMDVTGRMEEHIGEKVRPGSGVMVPSASDMSAIVEYLEKHAKPET